MRKIIFLLLSISLSFTAVSQVEIDRYNWDSEVAFKNSGVPFEKSFGPLSDSLRNTTDDQTHFYFLDDEYYAVDSWADYFLWYSKKYQWKFVEGIHAYEFYHLTNNNEEMMRFVFENSQIGINYPIASSVTFTPLTNRRRLQSPVLFEKQITSLSSTSHSQVNNPKPKATIKPTSTSGIKSKN